MPINRNRPFMPFEKARKIFLGSYQRILSDPTYSPQNIWVSTLGYQQTNIHATPAYADALINFVAKLLNDNDIGAMLETLFKHSLMLHTGASGRVRAIAKILTPGLEKEVKKEALKLGSISVAREICYQCPCMFIEDLFDELEKRHIILPPWVRQFYEALDTLSVWAISKFI